MEKRPGAKQPVKLAGARSPGKATAGEHWGKPSPKEEMEVSAVHLSRKQLRLLQAITFVRQKSPIFKAAGVRASASQIVRSLIERHWDELTAEAGHHFDPDSDD